MTKVRNPTRPHRAWRAGVPALRPEPRPGRTLCSLMPAPAAVDHDAYSPGYLRGILGRARTIAVIGASPEPWRPSFGVMRYLRRAGYRVIAVNPTAAGISPPVGPRAPPPGATRPLPSGEVSRR